MAAAAVAATDEPLATADAPIGVTAAAAVQTKPVDGLAIPGVFPLDALGSVATPTAAGQVFRLSGGFVDALRVQLRRIETTDGKPGYDVQFKISGPSRGDFSKRMDKLGASRAAFEFYGAEVKGSGAQARLTRDGKTHALTSSYSSHKAPDTASSANLAYRLEGTNYKLDYIPTDGPIAMRGAVRIEVLGTDAECQTALKQAIDKAGLQAAFAPVTENAARRYAMMRLLYQVAPDAAKNLASKPITDLKLATIEKALTDAGVSASRIAGLRYLEVASSHFTVVDDHALEEMQKAGLRYAYSTVATVEHVHSILTNGQKATLTRWGDGMIVNGMSSMADVGSGGAQGVFSRIVTNSAHDKSWTGRTFKIILKPQLLGRMDIWGWTGDNYGKSWGLTDKNFPVELVKSLEGNYQGYNEIISPVGNGTPYIAAVVATSQTDKDKLVKHLKDQGYTPPNGQSVEDFVRLSPKIDQSLV